MSLEDETDPFADAAGQSLSETVAPLADAYDERIGDRDRSLWRWFHRLEPEFRLSCVDADRARRVRDAKVLATMFITVLDDVAERYGDRATFEELRTVPFDHQRADPTRADVDGEYVRFQREVWSAFRDLYEASPRAEEFADLLRFDLRQALQAVDYSALVAQYPGLASERELWTYEAHNMMAFVYADVDLANAPSFDRTELSSVRRVVTHAQRMARIGNWIATWERELADGDPSSGVVVRALESGLLSPDDLRRIQVEPGTGTVERIAAAIRDSDIEDYFVDRWHDEFREATGLVPEVETVDLRPYLEGFEKIFRSHLAQRPSA